MWLSVAVRVSLCGTVLRVPAPKRDKMETFFLGKLPAIARTHEMVFYPVVAVRVDVCVCVRWFVALSLSVSFLCVCVCAYACVCARVRGFRRRDSEVPVPSFRRRPVSAAIRSVGLQHGGPPTASVSGVRRRSLNCTSSRAYKPQSSLSLSRSRALSPSLPPSLPLCPLYALCSLGTGATPLNGAPPSSLSTSL